MQIIFKGPKILHFYNIAGPNVSLDVQVVVGRGGGDEWELNTYNSKHQINEFINRKSINGSIQETVILAYIIINSGTVINNYV